jgi:hypothetical protein
VPKWHTGRTPLGRLSPSLPPPYPHRAPTVPPPYPNRDLKCAILAQFGHSSGCPGHSKAREDCRVAWQAIWIDVPAVDVFPIPNGSTMPVSQNIAPRAICKLWVLAHLSSSSREWTPEPRLSYSRSRAAEGQH